MTESQARTEAQKRADSSGCTVFVAYQAGLMAPDWRNRFVACYAMDWPTHATEVAECKPAGRFYGKHYQTPGGRWAL